jgi:hypothetical protein
MLRHSAGYLAAHASRVTWRSPSHGARKLLSHLAIDEALDEPGIDHFASVAVVDAVGLDFRAVLT